MGHATYKRLGVPSWHNVPAGRGRLPFIQLPDHDDPVVFCKLLALTL